jgi:tRNA A-37 threonylcarbamoyl transferase component Bud32
MAFFCIHCKAKIDPKFKACPHCGEPVTDFLRRHLEEPVDGKYQILARLGVGGMAEVYKALHTHLNALRVIKLIRPNLAADPGANERFQREARLATKISHPNVAALFDFSMLEDGAHYMVWEYIEGIDLHELIAQRGPLPPRYAARLAIQALQGLEAIHRAGIVHRDVSPENLMLTRDEAGEERIKVIDLGIAKSAVDETTRSGFVGKWKYCSPEHLGMLGEGERIDARADLYSFGVVLYEMLAGAPPFQAGEPHAYVVLHAQQPPPPLAETNGAITPAPELERLVLKALEKNRENRFQTAREFAQAIEDILPLLPEEPLPELREAALEPAAATELTEPDGEAPVIRAEMPRVVREPARRAFPLAGVLLAVLTIGLAVLGFVFLRDAPGIPENAPVRKAALRPQPVEPGFVGVNAYPWARVTAIRDLATGRTVNPGADAFTPHAFLLDPGPWELTFANTAFNEPISRQIVVAPGSEQVVNVYFVDPTLAPLPDFGGGE